MLKPLRQIAKHAFIELLYRSGATGWAKRSLARAGEAIVLTLHRVLTDEELASSNSPAGMVVQQRTFIDLVALLSNEVRFISLRETPRPAPHPLVAVTFDDGWSDTLRACVDTLSSRGIPACVFICSHMVGSQEPFWPERALAGLRAARKAPSASHRVAELLSEHNIDVFQVPDHLFLQFLKRNVRERFLILAAFEDLFRPFSESVDTTMTWTELRRFLEGGFDLGSHTAHHEMLTELFLPEQLKELRECNRLIKSELHISPIFFSYPDGAWNEEAKESVKACEVELAFINAPGVWSADTDLHLIPRVNLSENRLIGRDGQFSVASAHYHLFWVPYLNRRRSRKNPTRPNPRAIAQRLGAYSSAAEPSHRAYQAAASKRSTSDVT